MSEELHVRQHLMRYEPPDIVFMKFIGDITGPDVHEIIAVCKPWAIRHEYLLLLVDLSDTGVAQPDARSASKQKTEFEMRGTAFFGASPRVRIVTNLLTSALNILLKRMQNPIHFFATEAQARAWLSERRKFVNGRG